MNSLDIRNLKTIHFAYLKEKLQEETINYYLKSWRKKTEANWVWLLKKDCVIFFTKYLTTKKNGRPVYNWRIQKTERLKKDERWMRWLISNTLFWKKSPQLNFEEWFKDSLNYILKKNYVTMSKQLKKKVDIHDKIIKKIMSHKIKFDNLIFLYFYWKWQISDLDNSIQLFQDELEKALQERGKSKNKAIKNYNDRDITYNCQSRFDLPRSNKTIKPDSVFAYIISF